MRERKPVWYGWDSEYPEEGSVVVQADTEEGAKREAAELLDMEVEYVTVGRSSEAQVAKIRELETALQEERARGAVVREAAEDLVIAYRVACRLEGCDVQAGLDVHGHPLDPRFLRAVSALSDPSPAAEALLEMADKAQAHIAWRRRADDDSLGTEEWEDGVNATLDDLDAAVDRYQEAKGTT